MPARRKTRSSPARSRDRSAPASTPRHLEGEGGLRVALEPFGPSLDRIQVVQEEVLEHPDVLAALGKARWRVLSTRLVDEELTDKRSRAVRPPERFISTIYDYTNDRTLAVSGRLRSGRRLQIDESTAQPWPTWDEFQDAVRILRRHEKLGARLREGRLRPYPPMPPLVGSQRPDGTIERTLAVGLLPSEGDKGHEIGVNLRARKVIRYEARAPKNARAHNPICGLPYAAQPAGNATPGRAWVTISQGRTVLWHFLVRRPADSSGTNGSGVELQFVDYRGKRVLYQAHVPILNIKYDEDACGPYRDRQDFEGMFTANGWDPAPGFRLCGAPAQTILDSGSDVGNFRGVAIYVQGQEVVLVSEMEAGWYRYISQWRFGLDGTLRARFGFSAAENSCVCYVHHHHVYWHVYWRLDLGLLQVPLTRRL
jgi:hypothetical protein